MGIFYDTVRKMRENSRPLKNAENIPVEAATKAVKPVNKQINKVVEKPLKKAVIKRDDRTGKDA